MQKVLVTGANGFIAYYTIALLLGKGLQVIATGRGINRLPFNHPSFKYEMMDFTDEQKVIEIIGAHNPGTILHCGAISKPDECELNREGAYLNNVKGTEFLLAAGARSKCHFVFLSTDFVFKGDKGMYREEDERNPVNYYGTTKLLAEDAVMQYKYDWAIIRTVLVYGKPHFSPHNLLTNVAAMLREGKEMKIFNDQVRTPTYVEDLAKGICSIILKKSSGIFHLSGKDVLTPFEMAVAVARFLKLDETLIKKVEEKDFEQPAKRPLITEFDTSKAKRELDYQPLSFEEGLFKTFA